VPLLNNLFEEDLFRRFFYGGILIFLTCWMIFLYNYDPATSENYPKCIVKKTTSLDCPGCGSSRSVRHFLHFEYRKSFENNPMVFISLPFLYLYCLLVVLGVEVDGLLKKIIPKVIYARFSFLVLLILISFTIFRNLFNYFA